jgi:hypothetical protein
MTVGVRLVVATGRWSGPDIVRIFRVASTWWTILIGPSHATTRWRASITCITPIIELAWWCTSAIVITAGAIATRRAATVVVVVVRGRRVCAAASSSSSAAAAATAHRRAGAVSITAAIIWSTRASVRSPRLEWRRWGWIGNVLFAGDFLTLELTAVQLLHSGSQIGLSLVFNKPRDNLVRSSGTARIITHPVPSRSRPTSE